jgi:glutathione synthase/RimK-type ligase-like ATP-grasp enzyme
VGAVRRHAAEGEWRTNVALGAEREATAPPQAAREIAVAAVAAVEGDLVGVDLMPTRDGGWVVIELNGAVEFNDEYSLERDVFSAAVDALLATVEGASEPVAALA